MMPPFVQAMEAPNSIESAEASCVLPRAAAALRADAQVCLRRPVSSNRPPVGDRISPRHQNRQRTAACHSHAALSGAAFREQTQNALRDEP